MKKIFIFIAGVFLPLIIGFVFLISGGMPVATKGPPLPLERSIASIAIHAAMRNQVDRPSPIEADESNLGLGAKVYMKNCSVCHGVPAGKSTAIAEGLFPKPPQLFSAEDNVTDDPVGEIYWNVKNGIRLTGMPGFVDSPEDVQLWQVSLLLLHADKLPESAKQELK